MEIIFLAALLALLFYTALWKIIAPVFIVWLVAFYISEKFAFKGVIGPKTMKRKTELIPDYRLEHAVRDMPPCL